MPGSYAIYPVNSTDVVVEDSEAFAGADSGIYVGQTTNCAIRRNHVHDNVGGIEIENSTNCEVYDNVVEHNTAGILVFEIPSLPARGSTTSVHHNEICSNDTPNFGYPGTTVSGVPAGIGIMLLAAHHVEVHHNHICGDDSTGILLISYRTSMMPPPVDPGTYDGFARDICLHDNDFSGAPNGTMPDGIIAAVQGQSVDPTAPIDDILTDGDFDMAGTGTGNLCMDGTGSFRVAIPWDFTTQRHDRAPYGAPCACDPIPAVAL
jgi:parallel beta-helix repeat protein